MELLPLWSCTHRDKFEFGRVPASSAPVESDFNGIKSRFLKNKTLPMRIDDFIREHVEYLSGKLKLIEATEIEIENTVKRQPIPTKEIESEENPELELEKNKASERHLQKEVFTSTIALVSQCPICSDGDVLEGAHE